MTAGIHRPFRTLADPGGATHPASYWGYGVSTFAGGVKQFSGGGIKAFAGLNFASEDLGGRV